MEPLLFKFAQAVLFLCLQKLGHQAGGGKKSYPVPLLAGTHGQGNTDVSLPDMQSFT